MRAASVNPFLVGKQRPMVVGHRGVPTLHQENTLAGFRRAVSLGLPAIELDVRLTADGKAVVLHDHSLRRLTGSSFDVNNLTWDQISRLRIRREVPMGIDVHGNQVRITYEQEERIPLLAEILAEVASSVAINVELKLDMPVWWQVEVATITAKVIADAGVEDRVIVTSFDPRKLRALARAMPNLAHGFCFDDTMLNFASGIFSRLPASWSAQRTLGRLIETNVMSRLLGTRLVGAEHTLVGKETVRRLHLQGIAIGTHTLFPLGAMGTKQIAPSAVTEAEVERLAELGVDWIETDDPERLQKLIG